MPERTEYKKPILGIIFFWVPLVTWIVMYFDGRYTLRSVLLNSPEALQLAEKFVVPVFSSLPKVKQVLLGYSNGYQEWVSILSVYSLGVTLFVALNLFLLFFFACFHIAGVFSKVSQETRWKAQEDKDYYESLQVILPNFFYKASLAFGAFAVVLLAMSLHGMGIRLTDDSAGATRLLSRLRGDSGFSFFCLGSGHILAIWSLACNLFAKQVRNVWVSLSQQQPPSRVDAN